MARNGQKRETNNVTMYNVSKKLVSKGKSYNSFQVRFKKEGTYDGYAGVEIPKNCFEESVNTAFYHIRMPKDMPLTMSYRTGIKLSDTATEEVTPRQFKDMFEATRQPKKKKTTEDQMNGGNAGGVNPPAAPAYADPFNLGDDDEPEF